MFVGLGVILRLDLDRWRAGKVEGRRSSCPGSAAAGRPKEAQRCRKPTLALPVVLPGASHCRSRFSRTTPVQGLFTNVRHCRTWP